MSDDRAADRLAIHELLARYSWALGDRDWTAWRAVFADGAHVDYSTAGGPSCDIDEAVGWIEATMAGFSTVISHGGNVVVTFADSDEAAVRSLYKVVMALPGDSPTYLEACGWYDDVVTRSTDGWRLSRRVEQLVYLR